MSVEAHHSALTQFHWFPPQSWSTWNRAAATAAAALAAEAVPLARQEPTPLIRWTNKMTEISSAWHIEDLCIICLCFVFFHFQSCQYLSRCKRKHAHSTYYLTRLWKRGDIVHHVLKRPWKSFKCCSFAVHVIVGTLSLLLWFHFWQTHVLNVWPVVGCVRKIAFSWLPDLVIVSFFLYHKRNIFYTVVIVYCIVVVVFYKHWVSLISAWGSHTCAQWSVWSVWFVCTSCVLSEATVLKKEM